MVIKTFIIVAVVIVLGIAGWLYYPQYQIQQMKKQSLEASKNESIPTYIDYFSRSDKNSLYHLAIGDSVISGYGVGQNQNLVSEFSTELEMQTGKKVSFQNEGINGINSTELRQLVYSGKYDVYIKKSDIVTVNVGGNDVLRAARKQHDIQSAFKAFDTLQADFSENLKNITSRITEVNPKATIVYLELYNPVNPDMAYYTLAEKLLPKWNINIYKTAKAVPGSIVVETSKVINGENLENLSPDGIHPSQLGYKAIASLIIEQFRTSPKKAAV
ncbi:hypothetical protein AM500_06915 [Bacillus sp. FJAT-18017]|uniref:SGNH/GDSL hydrolase family protein n=1 Tax=Bacillus sp. FJAT-18017 TaxID=1705566 RepID=UPI0006B05825|nr:SGNH/GDSL hydrolase family protein [Bacillus sp. FJAT-18017]ALC89544.1 hypothetical protein AM500_06915 [Bacillus sp. FJAT-18017]